MVTNKNALFIIIYILGRDSHQYMFLWQKLIDMNIYKKIGKRMLTSRKALQLTQENVAEAAEIETSFYGQIERGANIPSILTLSKIASALNIEISDLFPSSLKSQCLLTKIIIRMIKKLSAKDKLLIIDLLQKLSTHLKNH